MTVEQKANGGPTLAHNTGNSPKTENSRTSQQAANASNNNATSLSFDPMSRTILKRRFSQRSSSASVVSCENDCGKMLSSPKESPESITCIEERKESTPDIRTDVVHTGEAKLFADLPDPTDDNVSPDDFLHKLVFATCGLQLEPKKAKSLEDFFAKVTDEQVAAYTMTVVSACRNNDLDALMKLHNDEGQTMNCFNRFGESLLTMACRRGFEDIVEFLLEQSDVDVRISDDSGRTVLHDACWNPSPQLKICEWIMKRDPALFFIADNRGCTPFQYARPEHWGTWRQFLVDNKDSLQGLKAEDVKAKLSKSC